VYGVPYTAYLFSGEPGVVRRSRLKPQGAVCWVLNIRTEIILGANNMTKSATRKSIAILLILSIMVTLMPMITPSAKAAITTAAELAAHINSFQHKGTGSLTANVAGSTVTITGTVNGAMPDGTLNLDIPAGVTVDWRASYSGTLSAGNRIGGHSAIPFVRVRGQGVFEMSAGRIQNITAHDLVGYGLEITDFNSEFPSVFITGGEIVASFKALNISAINDNTSSETSIVSISGGIIKATEGSAIRVITWNNASVGLDISGGEIIAESTGDYVAMGIIISNGNVLNMISGSISAISQVSHAYGIQAYDSIINIGQTGNPRVSVEAETSALVSSGRGAVAIEVRGESTLTMVNTDLSVRTEETMATGIWISPNFSSELGRSLPSNATIMATDTTITAVSDSGSAVGISAFGFSNEFAGDITLTRTEIYAFGRSGTGIDYTDFESKSRVTLTDSKIISAGKLDWSFGSAIVNNSNSTSGVVNISGGVLFGASENYRFSSAGITRGCTPTFSNDNLRIMWGIPSSITPYEQGTSTDIFTEPSEGVTAFWDVRDGVSGISYSYGANSGFIPVPTRATVQLSTPTLQINGAVLTWNAIAGTTGYQLHVEGVSSGSMGTTTSIINATTFDLVAGGLTQALPVGEYRISVRAVGNQQDTVNSGFSNAVLFYNIVLGDVNGDGAVNASDALELLLHIAELKVLENWQRAAGNVTGTPPGTLGDRLSVRDVTEILLHVAGVKPLPPRFAATQ
jgi:hypothetical protein